MRAQFCRRVIAVSLGAVLAVGIVAPLEATAAPAATQSARVVYWLDGDTVVTTAGTVRLIGVDTPEKYECGAGLMKSRARKFAPTGSQVRLVDPSSVQDTDRYDRLLRYVVRGKRDLGTRLIKLGAQARYDSRTGYDWHPKQAKYIRLDARHSLKGCEKPTFFAGTGSQSPIGWNCPRSAPIKGNQGSNGWIYHLPGQAYYANTNPEECFASESAARAAGYRRAKV